MGIFEKYLTIWVGLAIFLGVVLGNIFPELFQNSVNEDNIFKIISNYINHLNIRENQIKKLTKGINELKNTRGNPSEIAVIEILKLLKV